MDELSVQSVAEAVEARLVTVADPHARQEVERSAQRGADTVDRIISFFYAEGDGEHLMGRFVLDWAGVDGSVTPEDVARVARVALAADARPMTDETDVHRCAFILAREDPEEAVLRASYRLHVTIPVARPVPESQRSDPMLARARFGNRRASAGFKFEGVEFDALTADQWDQLFSDCGDDPRRALIVERTGRRLASLEELEYALPLGRDGHRTHRFDFPDALLSLADGRTLPIQGITFRYTPSWSALEGDTWAAALADLTVTWIYG